MARMSEMTTPQLEAKRSEILSMMGNCRDKTRQFALRDSFDKLTREINKRQS